MSSHPHRPIVFWLWLNYFMIAAMVAIGGITRLTESGLSIVEWAPLFGAIPPLNEADWQTLFERYKQFPQYQLVNQWMTLDDFKRIFFWEYVHRLWGRLIGLVYVVPMAVFWARGQLAGTPKARIFLAFLLGGLQGFVGWIMVKSGLVDQPQVSHLRLALHFGLALFVAHWIYWIILDLRPPQALPADRTARRLSLALLAVLSLQLIYGAFMAGSRAGYLFATFPTMNGYWWPPGTFARSALDALFDPVTIHVLHRLLAYAVTFVALALAWKLRDAHRPLAWALAGCVLGQFALGVVTVLTDVHIAAAVLHQLGGFALLTLSVLAVYRSRLPLTS